MSHHTKAVHADPSNLGRREFVKLGALAGATAAVAGTSACALQGPAGAGGQSADPTDFELNEVTIQELQAAMASGERTARSITEAYLDRIESFDRQGPSLRSVIETNPDALDIAEQLDREREAGTVRGPLHGIPILVKDNVDTADRMTTTAGSYALEGSIPSQDSFVVQRLREAGAIILGKANLSEWANIRSTRSSSGWSGRGGQCGNPYSLDRNPCGSSAGSGAATSANFTVAAIGTETNGSVVCPSSANGVVGIKPTVGLVGRSGIIPISHTQDTAGPMARTVADAAAILGALTGVDPRDDVTNASQGNAHADYTQYLDAGGLQGARIGVARQFFGANPYVDTLMDDAIEAMRQAGATIVDPADIPTRQQMGEPSFQVLLYELKADMAAYLATLGPSAPVRTLADIIAFNEANADREMPYFGQEIFIEAEEKGPLTDPEYIEAVALARRLSREEGIDAVMDEYRLDAIIGPTGGPAWRTDLVNGDNFSLSSSSPAAISGYPNITVPAGFVFGLPVGISFFGRAWSEPVLLRIAYAFEQATQHRRAPGFLPSLGLGA
ncbi:MAG: amidase [Gemmatimonadetes bacterium]|nr:amidase [Gemmatimonadota bacterium]